MVEKGEAGHRQRLRERFLAGEIGARYDETLLELLLTFAILRKDVKPLAQELIRIFGSLHQVISASPDKLAKVKGIGQSSVALLQAVNYIRSKTDSAEINIPIQTQEAAQQKLFADSIPTSAQRDEAFKSEPKLPNESPIIAKKPEKELNISSDARIVNVPPESQGVSRISKPTTLEEKASRRKFQVSNGYLLEFDQLARILHFLLEHRDVKRITSKVLQEDTGLAERQIENLVSMGSAMVVCPPKRSPVVVLDWN